MKAPLLLPPIQFLSLRGCRARCKKCFEQVVWKNMGPRGPLEIVRLFGILPSLWSPILWLISNSLILFGTAETVLEAPWIS